MLILEDDALGFLCDNVWIHLEASEQLAAHQACGWPHVVHQHASLWMPRAWADRL